MKHTQILNTIENSDLVKQIAEKYNFDLTTDITNDYFLELEDDTLKLTKKDENSSIIVDFTSKKSIKRINERGLLKQDLFKAVGLNKVKDLSIIDATAGLGRDSFILASITQNKVTMLERNPIANSLLDNGLKRLQSVTDKPQLEAMAKKMSLVYANAIDYLAGKENIADIIYLDPMFNSGKAQKAAVKKQMAFFQENIGDDTDSDKLLELALAAAKKRVVVKRHKNSPFLNDKKPSHSFIGKTNRYDVYFI